MFYIYLWSIDIEAVLVAMSCFALFCQEADIRAGTDDFTIPGLLPNYNTYLEFTRASTVLTTGKKSLNFPVIAVLPP